MDRHVSPRAEENRTSWVETLEERVGASNALSWAFALSLVVICALGASTLALSPVDDVQFAGLAERLAEDDHEVRCLRIARRADYVVVFVGVGSPTQHLKLLLQLDEVVMPGSDLSSAIIFSERMHKSNTMHCDPFDPPRAHEARCQDVAMIFEGSQTQRYVRARFTYANDYVERALDSRAALLDLDGSLRLQAGLTYWLTTTHLCYEPLQSEELSSGEALDEDALPFAVDAASGKLAARATDLANVSATRSAPVVVASQTDACGDVDAFFPSVRLFPVDAASERITWLSLSDTFLYEYGNPVLLQRRDVVEMGKACADARADVAHVNDLYRLDCAIIQEAWCQTAPALPFRRLATYRMRINVRSDGTGGVLHAERSEALARIPFLVSYGEGLWLACARLLIMLLTAAVVFVRGSQNASSSRYMLEHVLDTIRCRARYSKHPINFRWALYHEVSEIAVDAAITAVALLSRILVFASSVQTLIADQLTHVVVFESLGIAASAVHFALRYAVLKWDLAAEAPLTKLAGPMSICDVSAAVLLAFSEPPLLSSDDGRFPAVGRLLIGILIAISVVTRCLFAAPMCAVLANTVTNDRKAYEDLKGYWTVLVVATALWVVQGATIVGTLCAVFVNPAAYALVRATAGTVHVVVPYCLFFGLLCAGLPTMTKVALRTVEHECTDVDKDE